MSKPQDASSVSRSPAADVRGVKAEESPAERKKATPGPASPATRQPDASPTTANPRVVVSVETAPNESSTGAEDVTAEKSPVLQHNAAGDEVSAGAGGDDLGSARRPIAPDAGRSTGAGMSERRGKRMVQATLNFGGADNEERERLKKEVQDRDVRIEELTAELLVVRSQMANQVHTRAETTTQLTEMEGRMARFQDSMKSLMIEMARTHRRDARRWQHQQHFELGHIASMPNPVNGMSEVWVEGNTARRLMNELNDIHARQRELEAKRANARGKRKGDADDDGGELEEDAEMRKMELSALKAAEQEVSMRRSQYKQDIDAFVKEVRRIHDEDASPFALRETIGPVVSPGDGATTALPTPAGIPQASVAAAVPDADLQHEERYVLLFLLGRGGFSEVWKAFDLVEGRYVACKVHKVNRQWSGAAQRNYLKHAERELDIQRQLDHPRLMKLYDVFQYDATTFISVMEFSAGEDLERRLKRTRCFREAEARLVLMQVLSGLKHLADQESPVIHYDLKPANIIFHSDLASCLEVKVTDFGLSKVINSPAPRAEGGPADPSVELTSQQCGTFYYLPPECFASGAKVTSKVDIWSCGVIFYQMLYGKRPFASDASQAEIFNNKLIVSQARKGVEFPAKPVVSQEAKDLIRRCLTVDVALRPDIQQLCADPYFSRRGGAKRSRASGSAASAAVLAAPRTEQGNLSPSASAVMPPPS